MLLNPITFHAPQTMEELKKLYGSLQNVRLQAGGTFLLNALKLLKRTGAKTPEHVISLRKIKNLSGIEVSKEALAIKAMTTIDDIFGSPLLEDNFALLKTVCRNISTQQIRNMATMGGNLTCRYTWTEMPAAATGLRTTLHFIGTNGQAVSMPAEEFYKNNAKTDKILTHVTIPRDPKATIAYRRVKKTQFVDIPLLSLIINTRFSDGQFKETVVAVNNCVDFAQRDRKLEDFLNGRKINGTIAQEALDHLTNEIYDRRSGDYKKHMFRISIRSAIEELVRKELRS